MGSYCRAHADKSSEAFVCPRQARFKPPFGLAMSDDFKLPEDCTDMREVRVGVDTTDRELMELLDRRFGYMRAAARIKTDRNVVRDEARKTEVIENARADAEKRDLPAGKIAQIWDDLVETSIAYELGEWDRLKG